MLHVGIHPSCFSIFSFFFFNDTATTEIYTLSLHDALPISREVVLVCCPAARLRHGDHVALHQLEQVLIEGLHADLPAGRSEEHTSELQSQSNLVCRLLLEKKKNYIIAIQAQCIEERSYYSV